MREHSGEEVAGGNADVREPHERTRQAADVSYEPPELTDLGDVTEITAGATVGQPDNEGVGSAPFSDRTLKENFSTVDVHELLNRAAALPLSSWSYKADDPKVRHVGPMAQDFHAAFGLGDDDRRIHMVDAFGVLLGCVQALHAQLQERDAQISALWAELEALQERLGSPSRR